MLELFQKIPVTLPKTVDYIKKRKRLLTYIGGKWFMEKNKQKTPIKRPRLSKEAHTKEDNVKNPQNITNIGMIGNSKFIGIILSGLLPEVVMQRNPFL